MNVQRGDKVSVIDEDLHGTVTAIRGKSVIFEDAHGFEHEFPTEKIVQRDAGIYDRIKIRVKPEAAKISSKKHSKSPLMLDLHFEKLVQNPSGYSSFERFMIQKEKLLETIDFCRKNRLKKLEIIHGVGDGVLQKLVLDVLDAQTGLDYQHKEILAQQSGAVLVHFT